MRFLAIVAALVLAGCVGGPVEGPAVAPPPGVAAWDPVAAEDLSEALAAMPAGYQPRTRHLQPDGAPTYTNRLIHETSPYLLQHAHNPVNWRPWGDDAFAEAARRGVPVFLSIGYSTCHWCHVMERESFEDEEIAGFINAHFVAIKVDREERPDVDEVYMSAAHLMAGRGGWPLTVFLTPERTPFFAGTYFPPRDGARAGQVGLLTVLGRIDELWRTEHGQVLAMGQRVASAIGAATAAAIASSALPPRQAVADAVSAFAANRDVAWGGFGKAPKFPRPPVLELLLQHHRATGQTEALDLVVQQLDAMATGGVHDQIGGGFHRYSVDARWVVPHFEKMLYDNAQLAVTYLHTWQATGAPRHAQVVRDTLEWMQADLSDPGGGFWSAMDADNPVFLSLPDGTAQASPPVNGEVHREEGSFYTWTPAEVRGVLGQEAALATAWFGVTATGNFEGRTILTTRADPAAVSAQLGMETLALAGRLPEVRRRLLDARESRPAPLTDTKVLAAWNGLAISALARAGLVFDEPAWVERAVAAAQVVLAMRDDQGRLLRIEGGRHLGTLDDHAFVIAGLLDLFDATADARWLTAALDLQADQDRRFADPAGGWFMTPSDGEALLVRPKPEHDGVQPTGNAVGARNLLRMAALTDDEALRERAEGTLLSFGGTLQQRGTSAPAMLGALDHFWDDALEVVVLAPGKATPRQDPGARALLEVVRRTWLPNRVLLLTSETNAAQLAKLVPLLEGKTAAGGQGTAYVCVRGACQWPTSDPSVLAQQLAAPLTSTTP